MSNSIKIYERRMFSNKNFIIKLDETKGIKKLIVDSYLN